MNVEKISGKIKTKKRSEIVSITDIAQAIITSVAGRPHVARARPGSILKESTDNNIVFNDAYDPKIYQKAIELVNSTDALIQETLPECGRRNKNNIKFQVVAKTVLESTGGRFDPKIFANCTICSPEIRKKIVRRTFKIYEEMGASDAVAKSEDFWMRVRLAKL